MIPIFYKEIYFLSMLIVKFCKTFGECILRDRLFMFEKKDLFAEKKSLCFLTQFLISVNISVILFLTPNSLLLSESLTQLLYGCVF